MVSAIAFATATSALLSGVEYFVPGPPADGQDSSSSQRFDGYVHRYHHPRGKAGRGASFLRGRVDSAKAEELLAGLGFNVNEASSSTKPPKRGGRRRRRPGDSRRGIPSDDWATRTTTSHQDGAVDPTEDLRFLYTTDFRVPAEDRLIFERNGHLVTRGLFSSKQLTALRPCVVEAFERQELDALRQKVSVWFGDETASDLETAPQLRARLRRLAPEEIPFLQVFNMFRKDVCHRELIEKIVLSPRLAHVAAQLLGCERVRLYQDSTFCKRPGDGPTRWHSDLNMAPLDCNDFVTAWIPLEAVPARKDGGSPLVFASRSHRDFALNHWQDARLRQDLTGRYTEKDHAPLSPGDITWHHGWTLHSSPSNTRNEARVAFSVSYFRDGTRLLADSAGRAPDPEDEWSYGDWVRDLPVGGVVDHPAVPLVWDGGRALRRDPSR